MYCLQAKFYSTSILVVTSLLLVTTATIPSLADIQMEALRSELYNSVVKTMIWKRLSLLSKPSECFICFLNFLSPFGESKKCERVLRMGEDAGAPTNAWTKRHKNWEDSSSTTKTNSLGWLLSAPMNVHCFLCFFFVVQGCFLTIKIWCKNNHSLITISL